MKGTNGMKSFNVAEVEVIVANLFGFLLPLLLVSLGIDPAVAASPSITSLTDITSLAIYFTIATWLL